MLISKLAARQCNAKTKSGTPCDSKELLHGGRCRLHGGLSTGPKTLAGKQKSAMNVPGMTYEKFLADKAAKSVGFTRARA